MLGATYSADNYSITGRINYFGEITSASYGTLEKTWGAKSTVDFTGFYDVNDNLRLSAGIINALNETPDEWGDESLFNAEHNLKFSDAGFKYGWASFPFSLAGREYYAKATYRF